MTQVISVQNVYKTYRTGSLDVQALRGVSFTVNEGEFLAVVGPSGSGKSTLMNLVGGLDIPTEGAISVDSIDLSSINSRMLSDLRLRHIGFVFQAYNLIPVLSAQENVEFVLQLQGLSHSKRKKQAQEVLRDVGLGDLFHRRPSEMSGGQQQRVAVARAIASSPRLILADEPTANLDSKTGEDLLELMVRLNEERNVTFLFSTHDPKVMNHAKRIITLVDGKIASDKSTVDEAA